MPAIQVFSPQDQDVPEILSLYKAVAAIEGGLARKQDEISEAYVQHNYFSSRERGVSLIVRVDGVIAGEIHCYRPAPEVFLHVLSDLTIAVHPHFQNQGVGRVLFKSLLDEVEKNHPTILRIELIARETNQRAIEFYKTLGFVIEGRMVNRIKSVGSGFEADIPMAWLRAA
ncbi:GNAT family N-acetyltransferase [Undibacterium sp. SXout20W]|uniref:GNAT family N-acetyltransferase n=1 Tax=Undibacterium sp. SXout20W TaxID=3413051 RepID=UPI003BF3FCA0